MGEGSELRRRAMNETLSRNVLLHGTEIAPDGGRELRAGPLRMVLGDGQVRRVMLGGREVVRRIYGAVRDGFWNTVPGEISGMRVVEGDWGFVVKFRSEHRQFEADFTWEAEITGSADGTLRYVFEGRAGRTFARNRIGLCVLHPDDLAGAGCEVEHVSGEVAARVFPGLVDPMQPVRGLHDFRAIRYGVGEGVELEVRCEGDVFEIEDQRNWTDASFKTYSTPQRIPLPGTIREGQVVRQVVTVRLLGEGAGGLTAAEPAGAVGEVALRLSGGEVPLVRYGLGVAVPGARVLTEVEAGRVAQAGVAWLRVDLDMSGEGWRETLGDGLVQAGSCGAKVEVVLHLPEEPRGVLEMLRGLESAWSGRVERWLVLTKGKPATSAAALTAAREVLGGTAPVGGGTDADFFQLNNNRPPAGLMDFVSVPLRPLAHQFDEETLFENLGGQRHVLRAVAAVFPGVPVHVSPVSFRTRAQKGPPMPEGQMPAQADVRQMALAGAAWLLGCLKAVGETGAAGVTLFQTTGLRGVMETAGGSAVPGVFRSLPGAVYPCWHVLAALAPFAGGVMRVVESSEPLMAGGVLVERDGRRRLLVMNETAERRRVVIPSEVRGAGLRFKVLDASVAEAAMVGPEAFVAGEAGVVVAEDGVVELDGYAVAWADC